MSSAPHEPEVMRRGRGLSVVDAAAIIVGVVVGAGIFRMPGLVAGNAGNETNTMLLWLLGGGISLIGAFCYAELATAFPNVGGDYHFLSRSFGKSVSFLFAWARMTIIQPGSIALQAYIIGDYMSQVVPLGEASPSLYAAGTIVLLTAINAVGLHPGKWTQNLLTTATVISLVFVAIAGLALVSPQSAPPPAEAGGGSGIALGMAMIFVLLTYGGWNEAAYLSSEVRNGHNPVAKALFWGIGAITVIYILANLAFLKGLGFEGLAASQVPAADLLRGTALGERGAALVSLLIVVAALSTTNATIITGARTNYALGRDYPLMRRLGQWHERGETPTNALILQGLLALLLVGLALSIRQSGVETMVAYTAPVFWLFFMLVGFAVFVLRRWLPEVPRPFRVPLYPVTPFVFCAVCVYMLHSSISYAGTLDFGAPGWIGLIVLASGVLFLLLARPNGDSEQHTTLQGRSTE